MEIVITYWWIITISKVVMLGTSFYKLHKSNYKSKLWRGLFIIAIILAYVGPIKYDGTDSTHASIQQVESVESNKELPKKVNDNSFQEATSKNIGITQQDIWK